MPLFYGPYARAMIRVCKGVLHQRQGRAEALLVERCRGSEAQKAMVQMR